MSYENGPFDLSTKSVPAKSRWWKYAVLRGPKLPPRLDGLWLDLEHLPLGRDKHPRKIYGSAVTFEATNQWEENEVGEVAVVYRLVEDRGNTC